jgi:hypothetical protein
MKTCLANSSLKKIKNTRIVLQFNLFSVGRPFRCRLPFCITSE